MASWVRGGRKGGVEVGEGAAIRRGKWAATVCVCVRKSARPRFAIIISSELAAATPHAKKR